MDNEIIKIHIWELPEKVDNIDKSKDYTMLHDGINLKKVAIERLYNYFSQDYKIQNIVKYFDTVLATEDRKYQKLYSDLEASIVSYSKIIEDLEDGFTENKDNIRRIDTSSNQMDQDINLLSEAFKSIESKVDNLYEFLSELDKDIYELNTRLDDIESAVNKLEASKNSTNKIITQIKNNNLYITESIPKISDNIDIDIADKGEVLSKNINDQYDKVLAIIDLYHHIK